METRPRPYFRLYKLLYRGYIYAINLLAYDPLEINLPHRLCSPWTSQHFIAPVELRLVPLAVAAGEKNKANPGKDILL